MECARGERVDSNINGLAHLHGTDNCIGHSNDNLDAVGFGECECWDARPHERAEFDGFLYYVSVKGCNQRGVTQSDFRLARQGPRRLQLLLARVVLCASGIKVGLREALGVIQMRSPIKVEL